jgi:pilus assembly protein CpaB
VKQKPKLPSMLVAAHALPHGTLLRSEDFGWQEIPKDKSKRKPGALMRGKVSETTYLGAITRRNFAEGEPLIAADLLKPGDRRFLSAVLKPGHRAVAISVKAPQSSSGLLLPGDYVDVILTQSFDNGVANLGRRSVGETILRNRRVVAVEKDLESKEAGITAKAKAVAKSKSRPPKTVTLEVTAQEAETLYVAMQLGTLQLSVRALEGAGAELAREKKLRGAIWAADVSPAIRQVILLGSQRNSGSTVEKAVRRPPPSLNLD